MKKIYFKTLLIGLAAISAVSCSDQSDEITNILFNRNFSPIGLEAKVRNRTNVELSWNVADGVTQYNIEVFANDSLTFAGTPQKTFSITPDKVPFLVTDLDGETKYSFRVMALDGNEARNSKWSGAFAKTESEQIFMPVAEEDIQAKQVTLRWPAGQSADEITLTPGDIVYTITASDIAAGAATITGLQPETKYTAIMTRNGKTRGKVSFTTGVYLEPTDILVSPGDDLSQMIADAPEGYRLVIDAGEYGLKATDADYGGSVTITKAIAIKGLRQGSYPVIKGRFKVEAPLSLDQVILDGFGTDGGQTFDFTGSGTVSEFSLTNSQVKNYTKGLMYINQPVLVDKITIQGNIISKIECSGGDFLDSRKGGYNQLIFKNNTVYESAKERDFFRMDDASSSVTASPVIVVDHNTLYNVGSNGANYRIFYIRFAGNKITFTNNLVVGTNYKRGFTNQKSTDAEPTLDNNVYFNTENLISAGATADATIAWFDTNGTVLDPQFKDAANGDFTVGNDNVKDLKAGDPRWIK